MKTIDFTLPSYWASALANGDFSGLEPGDAADVRYWLDTEPDIAGDCLNVSDEEYFVNFNDAGGPAGNCLTYTFPYREDANTLQNMLNGTAPSLRHRQ